MWDFCIASKDCTVSLITENPVDFFLAGYLMFVIDAMMPQVIIKIIADEVMDLSHQMGFCFTPSQQLEKGVNTANGFMLKPRTISHFVASLKTYEITSHDAATFIQQNGCANFTLFHLCFRWFYIMRLNFDIKQNLTNVAYHKHWSKLALTSNICK